MDEQLISTDHPESNPATKDYAQLQQEYQMRKETEPSFGEGVLVHFHGLPEGKDVYNPSGPFAIGGETYQWARVESREAQDAVAVFFKEVSEHVYEVVSDVATLPIEDPFMTFVEDEMVVGGVEIAKDEHERVVGYRTAFFKGASAHSLSRFATGPDSMKDIRMISLAGTEGVKDPTLLVFTRPYIPIGARMLGRIAVTRLSSLDELTPERLAVEHTEIVPNLFADTEWGGVNDLYRLGNGLIGALCHIAKFDEKGKRHYAAAAFVMDPVTNTYSPLEMIAERSDFANGPIKIMPENLDKPEMHDDLADVIFSSRIRSLGGSILQSPGVELTCGLSDAAVGSVRISNPFLRLTNEYFPDHANS